MGRMMMFTSPIGLSERGQSSRQLPWTGQRLVRHHLPTSAAGHRATHRASRAGAFMLHCKPGHSGHCPALSRVPRRDKRDTTLRSVPFVLRDVPLALSRSMLQCNVN